MTGSKAAAIGLFALLAGCATAIPLTTPSGESGYTIDCSGSFSTKGNCYQKAGELC